VIGMVVEVLDGSARPSWRYGALSFVLSSPTVIATDQRSILHLGQEKQRWRRKAVSCLRLTRAILKIFRSIRQRWTEPTWGGESGALGIASASLRRALLSDTAPPERDSPVRNRTDYAAPAVRAYLTIIEREAVMVARTLHPDAA
jgi:hypothetical protein